MRGRRHGPHHQSRSKIYWVVWVKIKGSGSSNQSRIRIDGWQCGKDESKRPDTFRVIGVTRSFKVSDLCFHSFLITP